VDNDRSGLARRAAGEWIAKGRDMERIRETAESGVTESVLTVPEAAELLGVTQQRVRFLIRRRKLPARKLGRDWIVSRSAVEERKRQLSAEGRAV
jgi:excisionase family DNA binding protein